MNSPSNSEKPPQRLERRGLSACGRFSLLAAEFIPAIAIYPGNRDIHPDPPPAHHALPILANQTRQLSHAGLRCNPVS
ncbi:MAG: hypothetical protein R2932_59775 [Caldilineaceae bacterium]